MFYIFISKSKVYASDIKARRLYQKYETITTEDFCRTYIKHSYTRTPRISFKVPLSRKMFCFWLNITWLALQVINNNTLNYSSKRSPETYTKEDLNLLNFNTDTAFTMFMCTFLAGHDQVLKVLVGSNSWFETTWQDGYVLLRK